MYTAVYKKTARGYVAWLEEIPGVHTQGTTKREVTSNLRDALRQFVSARRTLTQRQKGSSSLRRERFTFSE